MTLVDEERQNALIDYLQNHLVASHRASGGSAANSIIAASYFGCNNFYSCKVANDENGAFYLNDIHAAGIATPAHITPPAGITGKCLVMITPDAERTMNTFLGISETLSVNELDVAAIAQSHYVYIEGYLVTSPTGRAAAIELRKHAEANCPELIRPGDGAVFPRWFSGNDWRWCGFNFLQPRRSHRFYSNPFH
jgi:sugar/nucleoside kinase (ribokinase family)